MPTGRPRRRPDCASSALAISVRSRPPRTWTPGGAEFTTLGEVILLRCLANDLRQERERQGLTREQLAGRLNTSPEALAEIEAGTVGTVTLGVLSRIAHALGKQIA